MVIRLFAVENPVHNLVAVLQRSPCHDVIYILKPWLHLKNYFLFPISVDTPRRSTPLDSLRRTSPRKTIRLSVKVRALRAARAHRDRVIDIRERIPTCIQSGLYILATTKNHCEMNNSITQIKKQDLEKDAKEVVTLVGCI